TEQWGKPPREEDLLFLLLTVGVFHVGLSWKAAAGKKVAFMKNFCQMKPEKVDALLPEVVDRIEADPDMSRNRRKIEA
ncbi:DNA-3-methyladenine glycosylase I, partial [Enterococcus faecalis]|uniref:DNA-3-methyladenine glycosylase I n=1 Tax=Enterococcus faecalis TaxID=1351 RepID=UPI003CC6936C